MKRIILLLSLCISMISCGKSSDNSIDKPEANITPSGFSHQILDGFRIQSIAFDQFGNAWIGTYQQGLIKYNSAETIVYNSENSIISDTSIIRNIAIDSKNNIWFSCDGLMKFDGSDFIHFNTENSPIPVNFVNSLAIDSKDNIWFSSSRVKQGGLVKYNNEEWTVFTPENSELPINLINSIAIDKDDQVWLALTEYVTQSYLVKISDDSWSVYNDSDLGFSPYFINNIQANSKNHICGTISYAFSSSFPNVGPQAFIFDGDSSQQIQYNNTSSIMFTCIDKEDHIWAGAPRTYAMFNGQNWMVDDTSFKVLEVLSIAQAPDDKMWIGTLDGVYIQD